MKVELHVSFDHSKSYKELGSYRTDSYGSTRTYERRHWVCEYSVLDVPIYCALFSLQHETNWSSEKHISGLKQQSNQQWFLGLPATLKLLRRYKGKMRKFFKTRPIIFYKGQQNLKASGNSDVCDSTRKYWTTPFPSLHSYRHLNVVWLTRIIVKITEHSCVFEEKFDLKIVFCQQYGLTEAFFPS